MEKRASAEKAVRGIWRKTRRWFSVYEKRFNYLRRFDDVQRPTSSNVQVNLGNAFRNSLTIRLQIM